MAVKQTAGREALGEFAPKFAELNDDVLFGQVWSREEMCIRDSDSSHYCTHRYLPNRKHYMEIHVPSHFTPLLSLEVLKNKHLVHLFLVTHPLDCHLHYLEYLHQPS